MANTPLFAFRLDSVKAQQLRELSRVYGAETPSHFLREMVGAVVSGDPSTVEAFNTRLFQKMGEQLALDFTAKAEAATRSTRKALVTSETRKPRKLRRTRNERTT